MKLRINTKSKLSSAANDIVWEGKECVFRRCKENV